MIRGLGFGDRVIRGLGIKEDKKNSQYNNITIEQYNNRKSFTLLEVMVAIVVFALVIAAAGGTFISVQQAWQRQKQTIDLIQNARWAMGFMSNEIRQGGNVVVGSESWGGESVFRLQFELPPGGANNRVRYFRGNGASFGPTSVLYRKSGAGLGPPADRQELANFIVDNPSGNAIFRQHPSISNLYIIELTIEKNNKQYTLRSQVRPRN